MHFSSTILPVALAMTQVKKNINHRYFKILNYFAVSSESSRPKAAAKTGYSSSANSYPTNGTVGLSSSAAASSGASLYGTGSTTASGSTSVGVSAGASGSSGEPSDDTSSSVQFMWQPLSDINYPTITLLASFKVSGSKD